MAHNSSNYSQRGTPASSQIIFLEDKVKELEEQIENLLAWKESAMLVEESWNIQKVARLMGLLPGSDIRREIEPFIRRMKAALAESDARVAGLLEEITRLENAIKELKRLREVLQKISAWGCNGHCVDLCGSKCPCCLAEEALAK
jgi:phage shock protein A